MKTNKFISKKKLLFAALGSVAIASPLVLSSCSDVRTKLLNATVSKGDGNYFATNLSLEQISFNSLKYNTGQQEFLDYIANKLAYQWMQFAAEQPNQAQYANLLKEEKRTVNNDYDDLVDSYKDSDSKNWDLNLQQKELDPNGGTVANYKEKKYIEWAKTQLSTKLFENDYSTLVNKTDNSIVITKPSYDNILNVLKNTGDYTFGFSANAIQNERYEPTNADIEYAKFQKFIFDKWVEIENPFVVNMSLWKYGTPTEANGISDWYNVETTTSDDNTGDDTTTTTTYSATTLADDTTDDGSGDGDSSTTTSTAGTYTNPYFQMPTSNDSNSTVQKYKNFITASKSNSNFELETSSTTGLKRISNDYTEDSSTYILAKNGSIYSDLYPEFAAASSYLYASQINSGSSDIVTKKSISKNITETTTSDLGFDTITKEFVSKTTFKTNGATDIKETHLDKTYVNQIIKEDGPLSKARDTDLYVIDAYQVGDSNLNKFMMIRDEAGVHAISIDGDTYISKATTSSDAKTKAGDIVMYHSILGRQNYANSYNNGFTIDLKSELSTFFSDNMTYLILEYAQKTYGENDNTNPSNNQQMFDLDTLFDDLSASYKTFVKSLNDLLFNIKIETRQNDYITKMYETKSKYSSNYGVDAYKNGLAAQWIYATDNSKVSLSINDNYKYELTNVVKNSQKTEDLTKAFQTELDKFFPLLTISPLKSDFSGFQYSEYIYTSNEFINAAIDGYLTESTNITNDVKERALLNYIGSNLYDFTSYKFKDNSGVITTGQNTTIDNVFSNLYFSSVFDSSTNKWMNLTSTYNVSGGTNGTTPTITKDNLLKYKKDLWTDSIKNVGVSTNRTKYMSLLTTVSTVKYLLDNDATKFMDWLSTKVVYGKNAFIVWENSQNAKLNQSTLTKTTSEELLKSDTIQINSDNSYASGYIKDLSTTNGTSSNAIVDNTKQSVFGYSTDYYKVVGNNVGFKGIQTNASNSLSTVISNRLFTNDKINNTNNTGILNSYISKDELLKYIDTLTTTTAINDLATELSSKLSLDLSTFSKTGLSLKQKKEELKNILSTQANITEDMFKARNGYIGDGTSNNVISDASPNSQVQYGAKVIQLNQNDITSKDKLLSTLSAADSTNANEIFYSLLVEAAMDTSVQTEMINTISSTNKVTVYDKRTNNSLGATWASNWKYKND